MVSSKRPKAIDLFAGGGGTALGLQAGGFDVVAVVELEDVAACTLRMNLPNTAVIFGDVSVVDPQEMMLSIGIKANDIKLISACSPCQGFSQIRTRKKSPSINDARNELIFELERFARVLRPEYVLFENVQSLISSSDFAKLMHRLETIGYKCIYKVIDVYDYGVPQRRRRLVMMGGLERCPVFPPPNTTKTTVRDAISDLSAPNDCTEGDPLHAYVERRSERVVEIIKHIPHNGGSRRNLPAHLKLACHSKIDGFFDVYGRMAWDAPAPTITGGCINPSKGRFLHPDQDRAVTLREAARLQGMPDSYSVSLVRGRYKAAEIIGNAFPPPAVAALARAILTL